MSADATGRFGGRASLALLSTTMVRMTKEPFRAWSGMTTTAAPPQPQGVGPGDLQCSMTRADGMTMAMTLGSPEFRDTDLSAVAESQRVVNEYSEAQCGSRVWR